MAYEETEGLVALGHRVSLFAPAGSHTSAELIATVPGPLDASDQDPRLSEEQHIAHAINVVAEGGFDILHSHLHVHALGYSRLLPIPLVSTLHGSAWNRAHHPLLSRFADQPFVSISDAERSFFPTLNYVGTVYNGIDTSTVQFSPEKDDYLLFVGRMAPEKAPDLAIETARRAGHQLLLAGLIEPRYQSFFESEVAPGLGNGIEYLGSQTRDQVLSLLGRAKALLMPLRWDEPFGLVVIESLASGTPVIGWRRGALPELIVEGEHGFLVESPDEAARAVARVGRLDPAAARRHVEARFSRHRMAEDYAGIFGRLARRSDASTARSQRTRSDTPATV